MKCTSNFIFIIVCRTKETWTWGCIWAIKGNNCCHPYRHRSETAIHERWHWPLSVAAKSQEPTCTLLPSTIPTCGSQCWKRKHHTQMKQNQLEAKASAQATWDQTVLLMGHWWSLVMGEALPHTNPSVSNSSTIKVIAASTQWGKRWRAHIKFCLPIKGTGH